MNDTLAAAIARITASLPAGTPPTETELGYGRDKSCLTDCSDDFAEIGPNDPRILVQAGGRRLQTPRGTMRDDLDYGFDMRGLVHKPLTQKEIRQLQGQVVGELEKDIRVERVDVTLTYANHRIRATVRYVPRDPRIAPFTTVYRITAQDVTTEV